MRQRKRLRLCRTMPSAVLTFSSLRTFFLLFYMMCTDDVQKTLVKASSIGFHRRMTPTTTSSSSCLEHHRLDGNGRRRDPCRPLDFLLLVSSTTNGVSSNYENHVDSITPSDDVQQQPSSNSFWPPWPFNMLQRTDLNDILDEDGRSRSKSPPNTVLFRLFHFAKTSTKVGIRNAQEFGSQLWFHSPPAIPPLILYALWPYRTRVLVSTSTTNAADVVISENVLYKTILPLWSNGWVRNGVLFTSALAIASWAHAEIHRKRKLTPLPLLYNDLLRAELPPFLPEQVSTYVVPTNAGALFSANMVQEDGESGSSALTTPLPTDGDDVNSDEGILANLSPRRWRRHFLQFRNDIAPRPFTLRNRFRDWQRMQQIYKAEQKNAHRLAIYEELILWQQATRKKGQTSSKRSNREWQRRKIFNKWNPFRKSKYRLNSSDLMSENDDSNSNSTSLGYALVTGASQGIGRAIAIELARWQIPLILVARDIQALTELAYDIQTCYGIDCTVLSADLSRPNASEQIYKTVTEAGLKVDVSTGLRISSDFGAAV
jgi:short chain dehydrogenase